MDASALVLVYNVSDGHEIQELKHFTQIENNVVAIFVTSPGSHFWKKTFSVGGGGEIPKTTWWTRIWITYFKPTITSEMNFPVNIVSYTQTKKKYVFQVGKANALCSVLSASLETQLFLWHPEILMMWLHNDFTNWPFAKSLIDRRLDQSLCTICHKQTSQESRLTSVNLRNVYIDVFLQLKLKTSDVHSCIFHAITSKMKRWLVHLLLELRPYSYLSRLLFLNFLKNDTIRTLRLFDTRSNLLCLVCCRFPLCSPMNCSLRQNVYKHSKNMSCRCKCRHQINVYEMHMCYQGNVFNYNVFAYPL